MSKSLKKALSLSIFVMVLIVLVSAVQAVFDLRAMSQGYPPPNAIAIPVTVTPGGEHDNLQLNTFPVIYITITPIPSPTRYIAPTQGPTPTPTVPGQPPTATPFPPGGIPTTTPAIGGPTAPTGFYCIDDQDPDMCDDNSSHLVPKGTTGISGSCGAIIEWTHQLVASLPQYNKGLRNSLNPAVTSPDCNYTAGPHNAPDYISTFFVIDTYNLAGFSELKKNEPTHVSPSGLFDWWQSPPAGYEFIPYSPTAVQNFVSGQKDLTGCVMFLRLGSGSYHIGIVNKLELYNTNGDGVISILQAGTRMYIDRFPVVGWSIENTSTNQTNTDGVVGFGCHQ